MTIRKCSYFDWPKIEELFQEELPMVSATDRRYCLKMFFDTTYVYEDEGQVVGFAVINNKQYPSISWLDYLAVSQECKGKGIGSQLMSHCESLAKRLGKKWLCLSAFSYNSEAVNFYKRKGYTGSSDPQHADKLLFYKPLFPAVAAFHMERPQRFDVNKGVMAFREIILRLFEIRLPDPAGRQLVRKSTPLA